MNIAVILAGGTGSRFGNDVPKQFLKIAGKTVIEHTIAAFECHPRIDEIAVVVHSQYVSTIEKMVIANEWGKVKKILVGGKERYESSRVAISTYAGYPDSNLIFHDAVRPLVSRRIIDDVVAALRKHNAVGVAVPAIDTIVEVNRNKNFIEQIFTRDLLYKEQTPQGFKLSTIQAAYERALQDPAFTSTDDCGVVVKYLPREKVYVVRGEETNIKLTYKEDAYLLDKLFQMQG
ncbi:hypothetical protein FACS189452_09970 [Bacteroidia bacterium]|nr:hypothetical protein FACS189452_09970 [Bacteroidia bacterium]